MLGTRRGSTWAISFVLVAELFNEMMNRVFYGDWRWPDTLSDVVATLFWPCALAILSKFRRHRFKVRFGQIQPVQTELQVIGV